MWRTAQGNLQLCPPPPPPPHSDLVHILQRWGVCDLAYRVLDHAGILLIYSCKRAFRGMAAARVVCRIGGLGWARGGSAVNAARTGAIRWSGACAASRLRMLAPSCNSRGFCAPVDARGAQSQSAKPLRTATHEVAGEPAVLDEAGPRVAAGRSRPVGVAAKSSVKSPDATAPTLKPIASPRKIIRCAYR